MSSANYGVYGRFMWQILPEACAAWLCAGASPRCRGGDIVSDLIQLLRLGVAVQVVRDAVRAVSGLAELHLIERSNGRNGLALLSAPGPAPFSPPASFWSLG